MEIITSYYEELSSIIENIRRSVNAASQDPLRRDASLQKAGELVRDGWDMYGQLSSSILQMQFSPAKSEALVRQMDFKTELANLDSQVKAIGRNAGTGAARLGRDLGSETTAVARELFHQDRKITALSTAVDDARLRAMETAELGGEMLNELDRNRNTILGAQEKGRKAGTLFDRGFSLASLIACTERKHTYFMSILLALLFLMILGGIIWGAVRLIAKK